MENTSDSTWEDIPSDSERKPVVPVELASAADGSLTPTRSSTRSSTSSPARRRRPATRAQHVASPSPHKTAIRKERARQAYAPARAADGPTDLERWQQQGGAALRTGATATAGYAHGVLGSAARYLVAIAWAAQTPLALLLVLYLLSFIASRAVDQLRNAVAPLCVIPGVSLSPLCRPRRAAPGPDGQPSPLWADFTRLAEVQGRSFEQLLGDSAGGSGLALELKRAEMATADLATLVRASDLTSRDLLADTLGEFVADARVASRGLQKFHSRVGGAVDGILAVNDYALHAIEAADAESKTLSASVRALLPWRGGRAAPVRDVVLATFGDAMGVLSAQLARLVLEAEANAAALDALEERLHVLHGQLAREDRAFGAAADDLLAALWTRLGGNRRALRSAAAHRGLLQELGGYRRAALARVAGALQTLQGMSADMEELRERVAAPELIGARVPVEVHVKSIRSGLERLKEGRVRAREIEDTAVRRVLGEANK